MPLPAGVPTVRLRTSEPLVLPDGTPFRGSLLVTGPDLVTVAGENLLLGGGRTVPLVAGEFTVDLVPNDLVTMSPAGWTYRIDSLFTNAPNWTRYVLLPSTPATVELAAAVIPDPVTGEFSVLVSLDGVTAADVGADAAGTAAAAVSTHAGAADPHGDRAAAAADATAKVSTHAGAADPHGDRAFTTAAVSTHAGAADPHGDRAFTTSSVSTHTGADDPHGDRAAAAATFLAKAQNLADLASAATARASLGLQGRASPARHGYHAWTTDPDSCSTTLTLVGGRLYLSSLYVDAAAAATAVDYYVAAAATSPTAEQCFAVLLDADGAIVASKDAVADFGAPGTKTLTFSSPLAVAQYRFGLLFNGTTGPQIPRSMAATGGPTFGNLNLAAGAYRAGYLDGLTAIPTPVTYASATAYVPLLAAIR